MVGDRLANNGVETIYHLKDFSSVGITEVVGKISFYFKAMAHLCAEAKRRETKIAILIDFQGFNLKLAKKLKSQGVQVLYYVAPQAWAWKAYRAKALQRNVHTLFTILPFEKKWFQDRGVSKVKAVKHPLAFEYQDKMAQVRVRSAKDFQERRLRVLLLPGSRKSEVSLMLPTFLQATRLISRELGEVEFAIVTASSVAPEYFANIEGMKRYQDTELFEACQWADMCMATSGTVTLTTGILGLPTVVAYRLSPTNEILLRMIIRYRGHVSLTNIIHGEELFPEFLHYEADKYNLAHTIIKWFHNPSFYDETCQKLGSTFEMLEGDDFNLAEYMRDVALNA